MVTPEEHAARLRILRNCLGMLAHKDGGLVFDQSPDVLRAAHELVSIIRRTTPVTAEECVNYGRAAAAEMQVTLADGKYRFGYKGSGHPVTLGYRDSPVPTVRK